MNLLASQLTLDDFVVKMQNISPNKLKIEQLQDWSEQLKLNDNFLRSHIVFCSHCYQRQRLYRSSYFEILLLCWQPGQLTTIHDHNDSLNVTKIYQGVLTSRLFTQKDAGLSLIQEESLKSNELVSVDRYQIHQLANTSSDNLITLHIYAKPLKTIQAYCPLSGYTEQISV